MLIHVCRALAPRSVLEGCPQEVPNPQPQTTGRSWPWEEPGKALCPGLCRCGLCREPQPASCAGLPVTEGAQRVPFLPTMCWGQELTSRYKTGQVPASTRLAASAGVARGYRTPGSIVPLASPNTCPHADSLHFCSPHLPFSLGPALLPPGAAIPGGAEGKAAAAPLGRRLPVRSCYSPRDTGTPWPSPALAAGQVLRAAGIPRPRPLLCPSAGCDASEHSSGAGGK